jgi:hypothetical protein
MPLWVTAVIAKSNDFSSKDLQLIPATTTTQISSMTTAIAADIDTQY